MDKGKKLLLPLLCTALVLGLFRSVLFLGYVPSESMEPTLKQGSLILGWRLFHEIGPGDIIVFQHEGKLLVKRVAACPGDTVLSGHEELTVRENCYYVLGDNTDNSYDSRYWSDPFVPRSDILAKVVCCNMMPVGVLILSGTSTGFLFYLTVSSSTAS